MSSLTSTYITGGLKGLLFGALIGGAFGVVKTYTEQKSTEIDGSTSQSKNDTNLLDPYKNVQLDPVAIEAMSRFRTYESCCKEEIKQIMDNLDKLIALQVSINSGKIEAYYHHKATQFVTTIHHLLNVVKQKTRNMSTPHYDEDESSVKQIAEDYLYNIKQDVDLHLLKR